MSRTEVDSSFVRTNSIWLDSMLAHFTLAFTKSMLCPVACSCVCASPPTLTVRHSPYIYIDRLVLIGFAGVVWPVRWLRSDTAASRSECTRSTQLSELYNASVDTIAPLSHMLDLFFYVMREGNGQSLLPHLKMFFKYVECEQLDSRDESRRN